MQAKSRLITLTIDYGLFYLASCILNLESLLLLTMDIRRFNVLKEEDLKRLNKYLRAWQYMTKEGN